MKEKVPSRANSYRIWGSQSGTGTGFNPSPSALPVNINPPVLHTQVQFNYHRRHINLATDSVVK